MITRFTMAKAKHYPKSYGLLHVIIPVIFYIHTPIVYLFLPGLGLNEISEKENV